MVTKRKAPSNKRKAESKYVFKVIAGTHRDRNGVYRANAPNNIIHTDRDLAKMFNAPGCVKFVRQTSQGNFQEPQEADPAQDNVGPAASAGLEKLSIEELIQVAEDQGVSLPEDMESPTKEELIELVKPSFA